LLTACLAGYEVMIRFGLAVNGPGILYKGIWPTYLVAGFGSAAVAGVLLKLSRQQLAHALATAAAMASGANARSDSPTAKWLMAGVAAQNGVTATLGAKRGFRGELGLLDECWSKLFGLTLDIDILTRASDGRTHAQDIGMKPWCGARQTMSALAGFQCLLADQSLKPTALRQIVVEVPSAYLQMIDRPAAPASRQESFANLRYLFGLAAFAPGGLYDVARETLHWDERFAALAGKIRIVHAPDLDAHYPKHWPARIVITDDMGKVHQREIIQAPGDADSPLSWPEVSDKFQRLTGRSRETVVQIAAACQALPSASQLQDFLAMIDREIFTTRAQAS
jgi:2-methylcitrate dehydratase PrpD